MRKTVLVLAAAALALLLASGVALAAFPGSNGKIAFVSERDGNANVYVMNPDGSDQEPLTDSTAKDSEPTWSPDGERLAFVSNRTGEQQVYVMNADGTGVKKLTREGGSSPSWAPNGERVVFENQRDLWIINLRDRDARRISMMGTVEEDPAWSPNGKRIAFTQRRSPQDPFSNGIHTMTPRGTDVKQLTNGEGTDIVDSWPNWSPGGDKIVFRRYKHAYTSIVTINADGTGAKHLLTASADNDFNARFYMSFYPAYSPDGKKITFGVDLQRIWVMNTQGKGKTPLNTEDQGDNYDPDWQPVQP